MKIQINNQCHPVLRDILNQFAASTGVTVEKMEEDYDFVTSDYCNQCCGNGYQKFIYPDGTHDLIQCESCENLHRDEIRADIMMDAWKEGE